jgi:Ni,Fe-hydrogenase III large subunit/Ni,Fe-hydrogenase III component G
MTAHVPQSDWPLRSSVLIAPDELSVRARELLEAGFRLALVAAHDDDHALRVVYVFCAGPPDRRIELQVSLDANRPSVPSLAALSFPASRFEREMADLFGIEPIGHPFLRPLVRHQHWPADWHPMLKGAGAVPPMLVDAAPFPFLAVDGPGVYEIPVGPVHAGLIEPGHFRFSVVGEAILRMKARLWFVHRGIEKLFEGRFVSDGTPLAKRISGDTAAAHCFAYCLAVEDGLGIDIPNDAKLIRALVVELERIVNHIADLGAMCNDVGFGIVHARAMTLRERLLRLAHEVTGHRLLRGAIQPGRATLKRLPTEHELARISQDVDEIVDIATSSTVVVDRFKGTAVLGRDDARAIGVLGVVARASGIATDARIAHPSCDMGDDLKVVVDNDGDVLARFLMRYHETKISLRLVAGLTGRIGSLASGIRDLPVRSGSGLGIVEGWRGTIVHRVEVAADGRIVRAKIVDPSFLNWPALSIALADTIVPDFPLANKSFNLSYAGNDL